MIKITIAGLGYVGHSLAVLLSQKYEVCAYDIDPKKIVKINSNVNFKNEKDIRKFLNKKNFNIFGTLNKNIAFKDSDFVIIATPTNFDDKSNSFNTSTVESIIKSSIKINKKSVIIIKSTVPIGFTDLMRKKYNKKNIIFSPEFSRETNSLYDNLYPSRIIVGDNTKEAKKFSNMLIQCSLKNKKTIKEIFMSSSEAESVKLFANTYLAMRIAFINELDSFSESNILDSKKIIQGVCSDDRIGDFYNNPSFGYGGYCLPKDTKQLLKNYRDIRNNLIKATIESNNTRKKYIVNSIIKHKPRVIGVFRLIMKNKSDNFRESAIIDIIKILKRKKFKIFIYEPFIKSNDFEGIKIIRDLNEFMNKSDLIIANRISNRLKKYKNKLYTRDIFNRN